jgi:hypothetical protein
MQRTITESLQFSTEATADIRERTITVRDKSGEASVVLELNNIPAEQVAYAVRSYINGQRWIYSDNDADKLANLERAKSILECAQRAVEYLTPKTEEVNA